MNKLLQKYDFSVFRGDAFYAVAIITLTASRPVVDMFWFLKKQNVAMTPAQWVGVLLFLLVLVMLARKWEILLIVMKRQVVLSIVTILILVSSVVVLVNEQNHFSLEYSVKMTTPWLLLMASMMYFRDAKLITTLMWVCLVASCISLGMLYYEILVEPIGMSKRSGMIRYIGLYKQVGAYGIFMIWGLLASLYLYVSSENSRRYWIPVLYFAIVVYALPMVVHLSTYVAILLLYCLFSYSLLKKRKFLRLSTVTIALLIVLYVSSQRSDNSGYHLLVSYDVKAINGEIERGNLANGRGYIWRQLWSEYNSLPWQAQAFGSMWSGKNNYHALGFAAHGDIFRILFMIGLVGLFMYILWLALLFRLRRWLEYKETILLYGSLVIIFSYSVALTATFIYTITMFVFPILGHLLYTANLRKSLVVKDS